MTKPGPAKQQKNKREVCWAVSWPNLAELGTLSKTINEIFKNI